MVDTPRTQAALIAASADNSTGNYTNQNQRDFIVSTVCLFATTQTASYTAALVDWGTVVEMNSASALNFTVPPNSGVAFPVGAIIEVVQLGLGQVTILQGAGVTLRTASSLLTRAQYSSVSLRQRAANEWVISGDLA